MQQLAIDDGPMPLNGRDWYGVAKAVSMVLTAMALLSAVSLFYPIYGL